MRIVVQEEYGPPDRASEDDDEPLVIHQRTPKTRNQRLVIFVHGLSGSRYGKNPTWGNFPKFLYEDLPVVDVGLYSYRTGIGRLRFWKSVPIRTEAQILADRIRELRIYKSIVLIGHSLGGVLSKGAVAQLVNQKRVMQRLNGLFLMAAPQLGSLRVPWLFKWLSQDFRALAPHGDYVREIDSVFQNRLMLEESRTRSGRHNLPTWAVIAVGDIWVDPLSASIGLMEEQIFRVRGKHQEIVKPRNKSSDSYGYVLPRIVQFAHCRGIANREIEKWAQHERSAAQPQDISAVHDFAVRFLGANISPIDQLAEWSKVDRDMISVVNRLAAGGAKQNTKLVAYFCVLKLNEQAAARMRRGELTGLQITAKDLTRPGEPCSCIYIAGVIGADMIARAIVLDHLKTHISDMSLDPKTEVFTRPVTPDGLRLVRQFRMRPLIPNSEGIRSIYVGSAAELTSNGSR